MFLKICFRERAHFLRSKDRHEKLIKMFIPVPRKMYQNRIVRSDTENVRTEAGGILLTRL